MRKTISIMVALLLIVSIVPATVMADEDEVEYESRTEVRSDTDDTNIRNEENVRVRTRDMVRDTREDLREEVREDRAEIRERVRERVEDQRERVREAKERFQDHRAGFVQARARFSASCSGDTNSDRCIEAQAHVQTRAHEFLDATGERLLAHLDRLEEYVDERVEDNETSAEFAAEIDGLRLEIQAVLAGLPAEPTRDDLGDAADELQDIWRGVRELTREVQDSVVGVKISDATQKMENLEARLGAMRDELESNGADVVELDALLTQFSAELEAAASASTARESREHFNDAVHLLREIMHEIRDAREDNRDDLDDTSEESDLKMEVSGNVELDNATLSVLDEFRESFDGDGKVELNLKVTREGNQTLVNATVEGDLTAEQESLWEDLQNRAEELVTQAGADAELEIEIEYESEAFDDSRSGGSSSADDGRDDSDSDFDDSDSDSDSEEEDEAAQEALERVEDAEEEIADAQEKIADAQEDGDETSASLHLLAEARLELDAANQDFEAGLYAEAAAHAEAAEELASDAKGKWLGETLAELEADLGIGVTA